MFVPLVDERSGLPVCPTESELVNMLAAPLKLVEERGITPDCGACKSRLDLWSWHFWFPFPDLDFVS